jgi:hypothetical protein
MVFPKNSDRIEMFLDPNLGDPASIYIQKKCGRLKSVSNMVIDRLFTVT